MRRVALVLAGVLLALTAVWAAPAPAYACSCAQVSEAQLTAQADVVFTGTLADQREDGRTRVLTFTVDRVFKGRATATQLVATADSGASCGLELSGPGPFLVFADGEAASLSSNLCGGTRPGPATSALGPGQPPDPDPAVPPAPPSIVAAPEDGGSPAGRWLPLVGFVLAAAAAGSVGWVLVSSRRS